MYGQPTFAIYHSMVIPNNGIYLHTVSTMVSSTHSPPEARPYRDSTPLDPTPSSHVIPIRRASKTLGLSHVAGIILATILATIPVLLALEAIFGIDKLVDMINFAPGRIKKDRDVPEGFVAHPSGTFNEGFKQHRPKPRHRTPTLGTPSVRATPRRHSWTI